jgi:hypothetical protein
VDLHECVMHYKRQWLVRVGFRRTIVILREKV